MTRRTHPIRVALVGSVLALCALAPRPAAAWNSTGHMAVADIAYDKLTPQAKASVDALLMRHKDYGYWISQMPAGYTDRARFVFMKAATWPDDIRKTADDRPIWHFVDLPVVVPGYAADPMLIQPVKPNAVTQLPLEESLVTDKKALDGDRAIGLCWVEHLIGDLHQPLHDASLFSAQFPKGDRGGNSDLLTASQTASDPVEGPIHPRNLHAFWDDLEGNSRDPQEIGKLAVRLETPAFARSTYPQIALHKTGDEWAHEGNALARDDAYQGGNLSLEPYRDRADATLPPGYIAAAHTIADRQIALAGLRLADYLNGTQFPPVTGTAVTAVPAAPAPVAPSAAQSGPIIGNKRSHIYHVGDTGHLPAERNRVYFQTEAEAQKAGYHKSGGQ